MAAKKTSFFSAGATGVSVLGCAIAMVAMGAIGQFFAELVICLIFANRYYKNNLLKLHWGSATLVCPSFLWKSKCFQWEAVQGVGHLFAGFTSQFHLIRDLR